MINDDVLSELHYDLRECTQLQVLSKIASRFSAYKSTIMVLLHDVPLLNVTSGHPYATAYVTISVREYPENYQK